MESVEIIKPKQNPETDSEAAHRLELKSGDEVVGFAEFHYHNDPFPVYYISTVFTRHRHRGQGWGNELLAKINEFLDATGKVGLLFDAIEDTSPAKGLYLKNGWAPVPGPGKMFWYSYNLPKNLDPVRLSKAIYEIDQAEKKRAQKEERKAA